VRKALDTLQAGLTRMSKDVRAGKVKPRSRALRQRISELLLMRARLTAALPETLGVPFGSVHGQLTALEGSLDLAREAEIFLTASAPVRNALLAARQEARPLERLRGAKAQRALVSLTRSLDALIARLKRSKKQPATLERDLRRLAQLTLGLETALPPVYGGSFSGVHFQLRWLDYGLVNTIHTSQRRGTLVVLADAVALARKLERAFAGRSASARSLAGGGAAGWAGRAGKEPGKEPTLEDILGVLKQMNELKELLGLGSAEALVVGLRLLKRDLLDLFPKVYGIDTEALYYDLRRFDESIAVVLHLRGYPTKDQLTLDLMRAYLVDVQVAKRSIEEGVPRREKDVLDKLEKLNTKLEEAIQEFDNQGKHPSYSMLLGWEEDKQALLDEFPQVFGAGFGEVYFGLERLDEAIGRIGDSTNRFDLTESLEFFEAMKMQLESVFKGESPVRPPEPPPSPPPPPPPPAPAGKLEVTWDHDEPQSDICGLWDDPAQPGADVTFRLSGPTSGSVTVKSDSEGKARARFPVAAIGDYVVEVEVKTTDGRTASARAAFNNSTPTAEKCR